MLLRRGSLAPTGGLVNQTTRPVRPHSLPHHHAVLSVTSGGICWIDAGAGFARRLSQGHRRRGRHRRGQRYWSAGGMELYSSAPIEIDRGSCEDSDQPVCEASVVDLVIEGSREINKLCVRW